jgi:5-aminopentanamidase
VGLRVASFQLSVSPSFEASVQTVSRLLEPLEVDLACFPEAFLTGYEFEPERIAQLAVSVNDACFQDALLQWRDLPATFVIGFLERVLDGFYNSAAVIARGRVLGCYRKIHTNERHLKPGSELRVFERDDARFAVNICNDANFPELAARGQELGAQILLYPLNNILPMTIADQWREKSPANLKARALETGCWVISSDITGAYGDRKSHGCTQIVAPDGRVVAAATEGEIGFITHEIFSL